MFTGIIEGLGQVRAISKGPRKSVSLLEIGTPKNTGSIRIGSSVAVNGVCLTVVRKLKDRLFFHVVTETKRRSNLGFLKVGDRVNLERPLKYNDRIEGHFVLGHVDAMGKIIKIVRQKSQASFLIRFPPKLKIYMIEKGSVSIDGVSLTIGKVEKGVFWVHCIPHTLDLTTFGRLKPQESVNLEADILIKFFRTML